MQGDGESQERLDLRRRAANDKDGPEARIEVAVMTLARLIGRRIARERFKAMAAANDNAPADEAGER